MTEVNLLARYPRAKRNVKARLGNKKENRAIAMQFVKEYFDGTRELGYGGYSYDGRWVPIAQEIVTLPAHQHITEEQILYTVSVIREFYS